MNNNKKHWENIYTEKEYEDTSWYQVRPETSLQFIKKAGLPETAKIIDIGGGDSNLVDFLLKEGFRHITVLDISEKALEKAKRRLAEEAGKVNFIVADAADFHPTETYHLWHDRAAFHFLTKDVHIENYIKTLENSLSSGGFVILATFSKNGPKKCSGRVITQYNKEDLETLLQYKFDLLEYKYIDHTTPTGVLQNFTYCFFRKK